MFNLIRKDFLLLARSRSDLTELLLMPFLLISILGLALGNLTMTEFSIEPFNVAVVEEQSAEDERERFQDTLISSGMNETETEQIVSLTNTIDPAADLISMLNSEGVREWVIAESFETKEEAQRALRENEIAGIVTIPAGFSEQLWNSVFLGEDNASIINLEIQNYESITGDIVRSILSTYVNSYNLEMSVALASDGEAPVPEAEQPYGEIVSFNTEEPISSFQYYTIGMGVMFALHTAPALAIRAYKEKYQHVFGRLILSGTKPLNYLLSKFISGTWITFLQLTILFGLSTLIFGTFEGRSSDFWMNTAVISLVFSLVVGGITSLLTSITLYSNSDASSGIFGGLIITLFAFIGGSFTPVQQFSDTLVALGNWTPNGASMTSYLQSMQGFSLEEISPLLFRVMGMTLIVMVISVIIFPKRRLD